MNIKYDDTVICINNTPNKRTGEIIKLTIGKSYKVIRADKDEPGDKYYMISIINDDDHYYGYFDYRFATLIEYRKLKLNKLNKIRD